MSAVVFVGMRVWSLVCMFKWVERATIVWTLRYHDARVLLHHRDARVHHHHHDDCARDYESGHPHLQSRNRHDDDHDDDDLRDDHGLWRAMSWGEKVSQRPQPKKSKRNPSSLWECVKYHARSPDFIKLGHWLTHTSKVPTFIRVGSMLTQVPAQNPIHRVASRVVVTHSSHLKSHVPMNVIWPSRVRSW